MQVATVMAEIDWFSSPKKLKTNKKKNLYEYISHPQLNDIKSDCVTSKSGENTDKFSFGFSFAPWPPPKTKDLGSGREHSREIMERSRYLITSVERET